MSKRLWISAFVALCLLGAPAALAQGVQLQSHVICDSGCTGGSVSISGFQGSGLYAVLNATGSTSASTALPTGTSVRISNTGTTQVSCTFATGAATGLRNNTQVAPSSSVSRVNGAFDHIACIDQGGADSTSNVVVLEGGSGLGNDSGGGGASGGGGGAVTIADGADATLGAKADGKSAATDTTAITLMQVMKEISFMEQNPAPRAVTNAGTFVVQAAQATASSLKGQFDPLTPATWGLATVGAGTAPTNAQVGGLVCNNGTLTPTSGQSAALQGDANCYLKVAVMTALGVAEGSTASGTTFSILGADAVSAEKTALTTGQNGRLVSDLAGKLIVLPYANPENFVSGLTSAMTGTTDTAITGMGAPGAGLRNYLTQLTCGNSHATVGTFVDIKDGSGGTVIYTIPAAAVYGGAALPFPTPLRQPTTNTGLFARDQTTGANVICSGSGYKGA